MVAQIFSGSPGEVIDIPRLAELHGQRPIAVMHARETGREAHFIGLSSGDRPASPEAVVTELIRLAGVGASVLEQARAHPLKHLAWALRLAADGDAELQRLMRLPAAPQDLAPAIAKAGQS